MHFSTLLGVVRIALLRPSWRSCFMTAPQSIMRVTNSSLGFTFSLYTSLFVHPHRQKSDLYAPSSYSCIFAPTENWTHVYMNLFTRNSQYYHLLKYLLFLLKHPVNNTNILNYNCILVPKTLQRRWTNYWSQHVGENTESKNTLI